MPQLLAIAEFITFRTETARLGRVQVGAASRTVLREQLAEGPRIGRDPARTVRDDQVREP